VPAAALGAKRKLETERDAPNLAKLRIEKLEPAFAESNIAKALPSLNLPSVDKDPPDLNKPRNDNDELAEIAFKTETAAPSRARPNTDISLPNRAIARRDKLEPMCTEPNVETSPPR
jgi:hypothetical protein